MAVKCGIVVFSMEIYFIVCSLPVLTMLYLQRFLALLCWLPLVWFMDKGVASTFSVYFNNSNVSFIVIVAIDLLLALIYNYGNKLFKKSFGEMDNVTE